MRNFIGIEKDDTYFEIEKQNIDNVMLASITATANALDTVLLLSLEK